MSASHEFWTEERIKRLEAALAATPHDEAIWVFLDKLRATKTHEDRRNLVVRDFLRLMGQPPPDAQAWVGREISARRVLRDLIQGYLFQEGLIEAIPTNEPDSPEEMAERERLALALAQGNLTSEMVIEDRGPR